jgi:hypothetical protein
VINRPTKVAIYYGRYTVIDLALFSKSSQTLLVVGPRLELGLLKERERLGLRAVIPLMASVGDTWATTIPMGSNVIKRTTLFFA